MTTSEAQHRVAAERPAAAWVVVLGAVVAVALGTYAKVHQPAGRPLATFGFSGMLQMKAWLSTARSVLLLVQLDHRAVDVGAAARRSAARPAWVPPLHRWSAVRSRSW